MGLRDRTRLPDGVKSAIHSNHSSTIMTFSTTLVTGLISYTVPEAEISTLLLGFPLAEPNDSICSTNL